MDLNLEKKIAQYTKEAFLMAKRSGSDNQGDIPEPEPKPLHTNEFNTPNKENKLSTSPGKPKYKPAKPEPEPIDLDDFPFENIAFEDFDIVEEEAKHEKTKKPKKKPDKC
jgi:hypothetical protein